MLIHLLRKCLGSIDTLLDELLDVVASDWHFHRSLESIVILHFKAIGLLDILHIHAKKLELVKVLRNLQHLEQWAHKAIDIDNRQLVNRLENRHSVLVRDLHRIDECQLNNFAVKLSVAQGLRELLSLSILSDESAKVSG